MQKLRNMNKSIIITILTCLILSCQTKQPNESATASEKTAKEMVFDEVMKIHDEMMPKMGEISNKRKKLELLADSITLLSQKKLYLEKSRQLDSAFKSMMVWMREFNPDGPLGGDTLLYFYNQKSRMSEVKDLMENALKDADNLIN